AGLARPVTPARLAGRIAWRSVALALLTIPALVGIALHIAPYKLTGVGVRMLKATDEEEATDKIAIGLLLYPPFWILEIWAALHWGGRWAAVALLVLLAPSGFIALGWRDRLERLRRDIRAFAHCRRDRGLPARLLEQRKELAAETRSLAG